MQAYRLIDVHLGPDGMTRATNDLRSTRYVYVFLYKHLTLYYQTRRGGLHTMAAFAPIPIRWSLRLRFQNSEVSVTSLSPETSITRSKLLNIISIKSKFSSKVVLFFKLLSFFLLVLHSLEVFLRRIQFAK